MYKEAPKRLDEPKTFIEAGIRRLVNHCTICIEKRGDNVEK